MHPLNSEPLTQFLCVGVCRQWLSSLPWCPSSLFLWASWQSEVSGKSWEGRQRQHCWSV